MRLARATKRVEFEFQKTLLEIELNGTREREVKKFW